MFQKSRVNIFTFTAAVHVNPLLSGNALNDTFLFTILRYCAINKIATPLNVFGCLIFTSFGFMLPKALHIWLSQSFGLVHYMVTFALAFVFCSYWGVKRKLNYVDRYKYMQFWMTCEHQSDSFGIVFLSCCLCKWIQNEALSTICGCVMLLMKSVWLEFRKMLINLSCMQVGKKWYHTPLWLIILWTIIVCLFFN